MAFARARARARHGHSQSTPVRQPGAMAAEPAARTSPAHLRPEGQVARVEEYDGERAPEPGEEVSAVS
jgi:hypothetical protein